MDNLIQQYNNIGARYIQWQRELFGTKWDLPLRYVEDNIWLSNGTKVLDLGCWDGHDIAYFEAKSDAVFCGIDASEFMIQQARNSVKNPDNLVIWNFEHLPFSDESFDVVYAKYSFSYIENFELVFEEVSRVLKRWWKFIFIQNHPINDFSKKKTQYSLKETLSTSLFSTWAEITYYSHTLSEILSSKLLSYFTIADVMEDYIYEKHAIPLFMGVVAIKK